MITLAVEGKNNIKQQRFKSTQIQYLNIMRSFVYFPTCGVKMLCLCGFKSLLVNQHRRMMLPITVSNIKFVTKNVVSFISPMTSTWLAKECGISV
jgi:hypothetical protein